MIIKLPLDIKPRFFELSVPADANFLSIQVQGNEPVIYMNTEGSEDKKVEGFYSVMTGQDIPKDATKYLGSLMLDNGAFVLHYFAK